MKNFVLDKNPTCICCGKKFVLRWNPTCITQTIHKRFLYKENSVGLFHLCNASASHVPFSPSDQAQC